MVSGGGGGKQGEDQWSQGHLRCSQGCRRQDGFPGADRLLKNKGQREQTCISDALTKFHAENNAQQCRRITKFDREIEKYKNL